MVFATDKLKDEAEAVGLEIVGFVDNINQRLYRFKSCGHEQIIFIYSVRRKTVSCSTCLENKYKAEAELNGLEFITKLPKSKGKSLYKFKDCGHFKEINPAYVARGSFRCNECLTNKYKSEAESHGLEFVKKVRGKTGIYRFKGCGHVQEILTKSVADGGFRCSICLTEKHKKEAEEIGLELVGKAENVSYRRYRFKACGHEQEIAITSVRNKEVKCSVCYEKSLREEAIKVGLELIGDSEKDGYRRYKILSCGHEKDIRIVRVRDGIFYCDECCERSWSKPAYVYKLKITCEGFTWFKIGYSNNVKNRIIDFGLPENSVVEIIESILYPTAEEAMIVEQRIHKELEEYSFDKSLMKKYHTISGFTECFAVCEVPNA